MIAQKNVTHLFIGSNNALATGAVPTIARQLGFRRTGEILCDAGALIAGESFEVLYLDNDGKVRQSPTLSFSDIISKNKKSPVALAPQISHIGFNGTDGDIVETNLGNYLITLGLKDLGKMIGNKRLFKFGEFTAPQTAVKADIAVALAGSLQLNQSKDAWVRVIPAAICSSAVVTANKFDGNATVVQGSKYVTVATDTDYNTNTALAVGDFVRFGTAVNAVPTVNSPVYKVVELTSSTVFKVDRNITDVSGVYLVGSSATEVLPAALAVLGTNKWGVSLSGNDANAPFEVGKFGANLIYFSVGISTDFQTTPVRVTQTPSFGSGTFKQVAQIDWELRVNGREKYRIAEYPVTFVPAITTADTIDKVYNIRFIDRSTETLGGTAESSIDLMIVSLGGTLTTALNTLFTV